MVEVKKANILYHSYVLVAYFEIKNWYDYESGSICNYVYVTCSSVPTSYRI